MPDITMCKGGECTIKECCERYTAKPDEYRQAYFVEPPFSKKMDGTACEYLIDNRNMEWYNEQI
jgi:hypothetical protein